ncbi:DNA-binding response regulator [Flavipsychrobacter stenotrophus]|uniref:DNA-binding response regulator n=1 Tax=Flavipsychrobacter stenotrophus TaxID=2077091 RepID=A0A2S7SQY1_9BACT|nr:response regulator [Flavipsychrobacter stenotrophus]PQJ09300.1 DNA-binding response regulator [Flavipsychrobacter stenotrophus]
MKPVKVGIVEDEMLIALSIRKALTELGYDTTDPAINYTEALAMIEREKPDILLLDIVLSGSNDGIDLAWKIKENYNIPFIFLTANSDAATVERAKKVSPPAYLVKPFNKDELYTSIEICLHNFSTITAKVPSIEKGNYFINDSLFIKQGQNFIKVRLDEIIFIESDKKYVYIHIEGKKLLVRETMQNYVDIIGSKHIMRVHRSFAINLNHIQSINTDTLIVGGHEVPIGKAYREELLNSLRLG